MFVAKEGRVWCASVFGLLSLADVPTDFEFYADFSTEGLDVTFADGSAIYSPTQEIVARLESGIAGIISHDSTAPRCTAPGKVSTPPGITPGPAFLSLPCTAAMPSINRHLDRHA
jgi:hypothetical protein